jgi:hypothetical protein
MTPMPAPEEISPKKYTVEIKCTRSYVRYLTGMDTGKVNDRGSGPFKWWDTKPQLPTDPVPTNALRVDRDRANYLSMILNKARRITKVIEVSE